MKTQLTQRRLDINERSFIAGALKRGESGASIARSLGRDKSVINREISRNRASYQELQDGSYETAKRAEEQASFRRKIASSRPRLKSVEILEYVEEMLKLGWSPELISGRIELEKPGLSISTEAIYNWIYNCRKDLSCYLARRRDQRLKRNGRKRIGGRKLKAAPTVIKISIEDRPKEANERLEIGHMETDTMHSGRDGSGALQNSTCRKSRKIFLEIVPDLTAEQSSRTLIEKVFSEIDKSLLKSFSFDNGPENSNFSEVNKALNVLSYFCHPYAASERGTVESRNGFIRRFLPKGTDFSQIPPCWIKWIEDLHNNRPMKCLAYRTPNEVWESEALQQYAQAA